MHSLPRRTTVRNVSFFEYSFSIHYGVKFKYLTTYKTVAIETPTQHSIYELLSYLWTQYPALPRMLLARWVDVFVE